MTYHEPKLDYAHFMENVSRRNPNEPEFLQAVSEVASSVIPFINENPQYRDDRILLRMTEPDRVIIFRVAWEEDSGRVRINRGFRVQMSNSIGPYKGGLRFHPSVNLSILKFLAFEQVFKNSLTTLPMGGGKGGSDFDPKGKSDREVMRFCQAFMTELAKHIGPNIDVPAGDIGVGAREISYLYGQIKRLKTEFTGSLTGKGLAYGGSLIRTEATGYGTVYFAQRMLEQVGQSIEGQTVAISGSGNVAQYAAQKAIQLGAKVISLSDSQGSVYDPQGMTLEKVDWVIDLKTNRRGRIEEYAKEFGVSYFPNVRPWGFKCDIALPCATQNELELKDAIQLAENGCKLVAEGANMPTSHEAISLFHEKGIKFGPGKASNAGGVAVSGLEMSQNSMRMSWTREELDARLKDIMTKIHTQCVEHGADKIGINYVKGANIAGFKKVADAMVAYGVM
ncbi:MAG: NADP-specific glutamate dehydrogenase [Acidobacteria bacterium]|nr:NADP-specific glutamate dehydrogenase [Acidobacteriota bacterium]